MAEKPPKVGELIDRPEARDAIHIAVAPVTADEALKPGQPLKFTRSNDNTFVSGATWKDSVGIVDPYLKGAVSEGAKFWMFVHPNTITSLRHNWSHPAFGSEDARAKAESWIRMYAISLGEPYENIVEAAWGFVRHGEHYTLGTTDTRLPDGFWDRFETLTGERIPEDKRKEQDIFSCSC